jgi:alpha-glucosidase (family GH31 glycosyl hydrolase)
MRAHGNEKAGHHREPWLITDSNAIRRAIWLRYSFIHYLYTTFIEAVETGVPIMRPMFLEFPQDTTTFSMQSQFMFGSDILVVPKITDAQN